MQYGSVREAGVYMSTYEVMIGGSHRRRRHLGLACASDPCTLSEQVRDVPVQGPAMPAPGLLDGP